MRPSWGSGHLQHATAGISVTVPVLHYILALTKKEDLTRQRAPYMVMVWQSQMDTKTPFRNVANRYLLTIISFQPGNLRASL